MANPQGWPAPSSVRTSSKGATVKRTRPRGVEKLFNGTSVSSSKTIDYKEYVGYYNPPNWPWPGSGLVLYPALSITLAPATIPVVNTTQINHRLLSQIKGQKVNLAQLISEAAQTQTLFTEISGRIIRGVRAGLRRNPYGVLTALVGSDKTKWPKGWKQLGHVPTKILADTTLAWNFGVRPLLSDLDGSLSELVSAYQTKLLIQKFFVRGTYQNESSEKRVGYNGLSYGTYNVSSTHKRQTTVRATCYVQFSKHAWTRDVSRLGFTNAPYLIWEAIPFSWAIDYVTSMGDYLSNLDSLLGIDRIGLHTSTVQTDVYSSVFTCTHPFPVNGKAERSVRSSSRTFSTTVSNPAPSWQPEIGFRRALNLLSVSRSQFRKLPNYVRN